MKSLVTWCLIAVVLSCTLDASDSVSDASSVDSSEDFTWTETNSARYGTGIRELRLECLEDGGGQGTIEIWSDPTRYLVVPRCVARGFQPTSRDSSVCFLLRSVGEDTLPPELVYHSIAMLCMWQASHGKTIYGSYRWCSGDGGCVRPKLYDLLTIAAVLNVPLTSQELVALVACQDHGLFSFLKDASGGEALTLVRAAVVGHTYDSSPYCLRALDGDVLRNPTASVAQKERALRSLWQAFTSPLLDLDAQKTDPSYGYRILFWCGVDVCTWLLKHYGSLDGLAAIGEYGSVSSSTADRLRRVAAYFWRKKKDYEAAYHVYAFIEAHKPDSAYDAHVADVCVLADEANAASGGAPETAVI